MARTKLGIIVRNGNIDKALSIFKKRIKESGIIEEYKSRQQYLKPSIIKRKKRLDSAYKSKKNSEKIK